MLIRMQKDIVRVNLDCDIKKVNLMIYKRTKSSAEMKIYTEDEASWMSIINCKVF